MVVKAFSNVFFFFLGKSASSVIFKLFWRQVADWGIIIYCLIDINEFLATQ